MLAELLEYALVILVSGLVASFSVVLGSTFSTSVAGAGDRVAYSSYASTAYAALEQGSASTSLSFSEASLYCRSGSLGFESPSFSANASLPVACDFSYPHLTGTYALLFSYGGGRLELEIR